MQARIIAGDSFNYRAELASYPADEAWVLYMRLVPTAGGTAYTVTGTADGAAHLLQATMGSTAAWAAGTYAWTLYVGNGTERYTVETGRIEVLANPLTDATGADYRTHAVKMLAAIEATLEGRASAAQAEYEIAGRRMKFIPHAELIALRDRYRAEVRAEEDAARVAAGGSRRNRILVRL